MKKFLSAQLLLLLLVFAASCSTDDAKEAPEIDEQGPLEFQQRLNVSYGGDSDQVYDLYLPENRNQDTKVLILVHGGGWTSGDKSDMDAFKDFLLNQLPEIAIVNINYRLADHENPPYPMQTDDITTVVDDLKNKRAEYQIGTELGFVGVSAGGHLALLWSYALDEANAANMVCSVVGPTNLLDPAYQDTEDDVLASLVNQFAIDETVLREASPLFQVTASAPPTILFYGAQDPLVPISQGVDLDAKLMELGVEHEFTLYENEGHGWVGLNLFDTSAKLKTFIEKHL